MPRADARRLVISAAWAGAGGQSQPGPSLASGDARGDGKDPQAYTFGFGAAGIAACEDEHLHPGGRFDGQTDHRCPDVILSEVVLSRFSVAPGPRNLGMRRGVHLHTPDPCPRESPRRDQ